MFSEVVGEKRNNHFNIYKTSYTEERGQLVPISINDVTRRGKGGEEIAADETWANYKDPGGKICQTRG